LAVFCGSSEKYLSLSLSLREEQRQGYENRVLKKAIRPKIKEVTGGWRRIQNVELHDCAPHQILLG